MNASQNPGDAAANGSTSAQLRGVAQQRGTSRRNMLRRGGAVAASVAALTLLEQRRAEAVTGGNFLLGMSNDANAPTELHATTGGSTIVPLFHVNGASLSGTSTSMIVDGPGAFVGIALKVNGNTGGTGLVASAANGPKGTVGLALTASGTNGADAVHASSDKGIGVAGHGKRGGVFSGTAANVNLAPSTHSHPVKGSRGDLFVDHLGHLFFCRGGSTWVKLA